MERRLATQIVVYENAVPFTYEAGTSESEIPSPHLEMINNPHAWAQPIQEEVEAEELKQTIISEEVLAKKSVRDLLKLAEIRGIEITSNKKEHIVAALLRGSDAD